MSEQTSQKTTELSCDECRNLLSDYVDRELTEVEKAQVEQHLGSCTRCGTESARLSGLKKIVQHWDGVKGSGEFRKTVMEQMIRESQQVPSQQFTDAAAKATAIGEADVLAAAGAEVEGKSLPPIWVLFAATLMAVIAYFVVLWLRGG
jgi:anti-sigma factor RsiW